MLPKSAFYTASLESIMSKPKHTSEEDEMAAFPGTQDRLFDFSTARGATSSFEKRQAWYYYVNGYKDAADLLVAHIAEADARKLGRVNNQASQT